MTRGYTRTQDALNEHGVKRGDRRFVIGERVIYRQQYFTVLAETDRRVTIAPRRHVAKRHVQTLEDLQKGVFY